MERTNCFWERCVLNVNVFKFVTKDNELYNFKVFFYFLSPEILTSFFLFFFSSCLVLASSRTNWWMAESKALVGRSAEYKNSIVPSPLTEIIMITDLWIRDCFPCYQLLSKKHWHFALSFIVCIMILVYIQIIFFKIIANRHCSINDFCPPFN